MGEVLLYWKLGWILLCGTNPSSFLKPRLSSNLYQETTESVISKHSTERNVRLSRFERERGRKREREREREKERASERARERERERERESERERERAREKRGFITDRTNTETMYSRP